MTKKFLTIAAFVAGMFCTTGLMAQDDASSDIIIMIDNQTTRQQLWEMRQELAESNINFMYQPEFSPSRQLTAIKVEVTTEDGFSGNYESSLMDDNQKVYIIRKFSADADTPFCVGDCAQYAD